MAHVLSSTWSLDFDRLSFKKHSGSGCLVFQGSTSPPSPPSLAGGFRKGGGLANFHSLGLSELGISPWQVPSRMPPSPQDLLGTGMKGSRQRNPGALLRHPAARSNRGPAPTNPWRKEASRGPIASSTRNALAAPCHYAARARRFDACRSLPPGAPKMRRYGASESKAWRGERTDRYGPVPNEHE